MKDTIPCLNLASKLNRPLQLLNPWDYLRLLFWIFFFPPALRWYEETFVAQEYRRAKGKALWQAFFQSIILRHFVLQALILCLFTTLALALAIGQTGAAIEWSSVSLGVAAGVALGVAAGVALGVAAGVALGVAAGVALGVAAGVALGVAARVALGVAAGAAIVITGVIAILRPDVWAISSGEVGRTFISEPVKNPYVAGDPVVGPGFKGREDILHELKQLWSGTTQPPSVVFYGHRRMGKTSILRNINSRLGSEVCLAYVNLLILGGAERGLSDLFLAIADEIRASLPELPEAEMDEFDRHPELAFKQYLDLAQSALGKSRLIIALDEFEKLEEWMNAGRIPSNLLDTFRGYIQKDQNIAFAFAGLHELEEMTADYFNPLFASVRTIRVSFLSKEATFQVLANPPLEDFPLDFSREALERIWQLTGGQPYLVQLVGHYLVSRFNRLTFEQGKQLEPVFSLEDVEAVIGDPEFYSQGRYYFAGIWGQAGQGAEGQQELLKFIAAFSEGISIEGIAARLGPNSENTASALRELERHDILREKNGQWQFTVELMRRWVKDFL